MRVRDATIQDAAAIAAIGRGEFARLHASLSPAHGDADAGYQDSDEREEHRGPPRL